IAALELLADQAVADVVELGSAVLRRQRGAKQAEAGDLGDQLGREAALVEACTDDRQHAFVGEAGNGVLHRALLLGQQRADVVQIVGMQGHGAASGGKVTYCTIRAPAARRAPTKTGRQRPARRGCRAAAALSRDRVSWPSP